MEWKISSKSIKDVEFMLCNYFVLKKVLLLHSKSKSFISELILKECRIFSFKKMFFNFLSLSTVKNFELAGLGSIPRNHLDHELKTWKKIVLIFNFFSLFSCCVACHLSIEAKTNFNLQKIMNPGVCDFHFLEKSFNCLGKLNKF